MMGSSAIVPLVIAVVGGVVYHTAAKSIPRDLAPGLVLVVAYATALVVSAAAHAWLLPPLDTPSSSRLWHPAVLGLGIGAAIIELGYVLTYRAAWPVSVASVLVNGIVAAVLVFVGIALFGERLSFTRMGGMLLCLAGLWLLRR
jgi:multidrug transporter EmrE-like cation transporter